ncbi:tryptophan synthase subunit alpha [Indiicoccus explosivorum]|uniref:tryptophan synthase subunit alpha n=1 Tax=Indiicoccus explosivorum TaxID=1917864 RepID=UPI000B4315DB|nr:tryptophan synthase subunit alpha [Indiicoccus explosivorum]
MGYLQERIERQNPAFVAYIMAGDGGLDSLEERVQVLEEAGVTAIELGIPFSDPVADGPVIQDAGVRALQEGVTLRDVFAAVRGFEQKPEVPLVIMTYLNPVLQYGAEAFAESCREAGIAGVIVPDLPFEHQDLVKPALSEAGVPLVQLVTLTTTEERLDAILAEAEGFVYAVTVKGVTGGRKSFSEDVAEFLARIRSKSDAPVLAGFGISSAEQAAALAPSCDGFIVGSAIVQAFYEGREDDIRELVQGVVGLTVNKG